MDKIFYAKRLPGNDLTLRALSNLIPQEHIFNALDRRFKTYFGVYKLFKEIESGNVRVYGAFTKTDILAGVCFGSLDNENNFVTHIIFCRDADGLDGCLKCAEVMVEEYKTEGIEVDSIIGYIPSFNRAAIRLARKFGSEDMGETKDFCFIKDEYHYPCRILKKKVRS